ncbi:hypothetical protein DPMN_090229 [Dreissena polymorpha]|uniref:Uncharacterized protein n=1 Tax=Dreissena polymorpha TaxID=45954 RepID=A0A9D4KYC8_DREPO|nr:hypothetical protein DPMN_090229 [Dreissena polymorpha]
MAPWRPYIIGTNLLTKFHEDSTINVAATVKRKAQTKLPENQETRVKKTPPPAGDHETNVLTKFHEDWAKNYIHIEKTAPSPGGHVFPPIMTIFELVRDIYKIDAKNVTCKLPPPPWRPFFLPIRTIFELNRHIQKTHVLTKFHEDWTKKYVNETNVLTKFHDDWVKIVTSRVFTRNTAPPPGPEPFLNSNNISFRQTFYKVTRRLGNYCDFYSVHNFVWRTKGVETLTSAAEEINAAQAAFKCCSSRESFKCCSSRKLLLEQHLDAARAAICCSISIFSIGATLKQICCSSSNLLLEQHSFLLQQNFELSRGINGTNVLTKFREDRTINVVSRVFTRQNVDAARRTTDKRRSQKLTMST